MLNTAFMAWEWVKGVGDWFIRAFYVPELAQAPASPAQAATETIAIDRGQVHDVHHEAAGSASVAVCQTAVQGA